MINLTTSVIIKSPIWKQHISDIKLVIHEAALATIIRANQQIQWFNSNDKIEIVFLLTSDKTVRLLNSRWRNIDKATNVLAFANYQSRPDNSKEIILGDIALAFMVCFTECQEQGKSLKPHVQHLVVHGVLHLLSFDHMTKKEEKEMEELEIEILKSLSVSNPYDIL